MDETTRIARAKTFEGVSPEDYDAVRPGYPTELFDCLFDYAELTAGEQILEIGCGTGQATRSMIERGFGITCIEPSQGLATVARRNFDHLSDFTLVDSHFEDFETSRVFDLIIAATSFHWLDPKTRLAKCADLLGDEASVAIVSSFHPPPFSGFFEAVQTCYDRHIPEWVERRKERLANVGLPIDVFEAELTSDHRFTDVRVERFDWHVNFTSDQYGRLLHTFSDHIRLGEDRLATLVVDVRRLIDSDFGGIVRRPYRAVLRLARRKKMK